MRKAHAHSARAGLVALALAGASPAAEPPLCPSGDALRVVELSNHLRRGAGLAPLEPDARLFAAADRQAWDLARHGVLRHVGSDGSRPRDRATAARYRASIVGENAAYGQVSAAEVVEDWAGSPGHRRNLLLAEARHVGVAHVGGRPRCPNCGPHYWVMVVGATREAGEPLAPACGGEDAGERS